MGPTSHSSHQVVKDPFGPRRIRDSSQSKTTFPFSHPRSSPAASSPPIPPTKWSKIPLAPDELETPPSPTPTTNQPTLPIPLSIPSIPPAHSPHSSLYSLHTTSPLSPFFSLFPPYPQPTLPM